MTPTQAVACGLLSPKELDLLTRLYDAPMIAAVGDEVLCLGIRPQDLTGATG